MPKYPNIVELMREVENPRIRLQTNAGRPLKLSRYGPNSTLAGCIRLTDGRYSDGYWHGFLKHDGRWIYAKDLTPAEREDISATLQHLNDDPAAAAAAYGHATGNCCFCTRPLSDERSTAVGYGPICAQHYNLPWGDTAAATTAADAGKD